MITDRAWLENTFVPMVQKRGAAVIEKRGSSSAMSAANGTIDHVKSLLKPTPANDWVSLAVVSKGEYGVGGAGLRLPLSERREGQLSGGRGGEAGRLRQGEV